MLNGFLKLSVVEARMKMDPGGVERQALRLGRERKMKYFHVCGIRVLIGYKCKDCDSVSVRLSILFLSI